MNKQQAKYEARKALKKRIKDEWGKRLSVAKSKFKTHKDRCNKANILEYGRCVEGYCTAQAEVRRYIHSSIAHLYSHDTYLPN